MTVNAGSDIAISVEGLVKRFGDYEALKGVEFQVPAGSVVGVLGPNGAGKTTTVRVLATLLRPDGGRVLVDGHDVEKDPAAVRRAIGLTGQYAALDEFQPGRDNLVMIGRLAGLGRREAKARAAELLDEFDLVDAADRPVKGYSGGMRRRLDLAASLVARPRILFLDEPTTGLDPRSRNVMYEVIRDLVASGTTLFLTTQYLEEADQLADRIVVIDRGRAIADGTPRELKSVLGGAQLEVVVSPGSDLATAAMVLGGFGAGTATIDSETRHVEVSVAPRPRLATEVVQAMTEVGIALDDCSIRRPSLDDVFLALTGQKTGSDDAEKNADDAALAH
ncbi:ABC-2 type transport system ATP-binding protein [Actinacidiphila yanglinensis]|uniref:ABC-type xenobiotic transporter n=1 Tax=Actinacidiphila yanglinensis TaxID=310779 RepID=A0A1H6E772_9ACTN|nr:ATP-binding cassette domain-containing protein [Actinacidiphila yanglinensis]SEG93590.1 ABC-2 type transport system ATP-binding protein [Actinacidiphila yanglinensis]